VCGRQPHHTFFVGAGREFALQAPLAHHEHAIGERQHLGQIARHQEDGRSACRQFQDNAVDVVLRPDVDAFGRLVEQQHARRERQPFGQNDLLLVSSAQAVRRDRGRRRGDPPVADERLALVDLGVADEECPARRRRRQREIVPQRQIEAEPLALAILRHEDDAGAGGRARRSREHRAAVDGDRPASRRLHTDHRFEQLAAARADQPEQADNLARRDLE
jgi:hypothetical protein